MRNVALLYLLLLFIVAAVLTLACGSPSTTRTVQAVSIRPVLADAQNYPGGKVQFTATGYYNTMPSPVTPQQATWGACFQGSSTQAVSVTVSGVGQCAAGAVGAYTVWAFVIDATGPTCNAETACGAGCGRVTGTAELTCP